MVLKEVLKYIHDKRQIKVSEISQELYIPIGLVECAIQTLKDLKHLMLIKSLSDRDLCKSCLFKLTCNTKEIKMFKSYVITEKGKKMLNDPQ